MSDRPESAGPARDVGSMTISEIRLLVAGAHPEPGDLLWSALEADDRKGVRDVLERRRRRLAAAERERERTADMRRFEAELWEEGHEIVAGVDEAGRGPLAGPVVAAAVVLPRNLGIEGIDDSKKLSPRKREKLHGLILRDAFDVGVGCVPQAVIDEKNILRATFQAMREALAELAHRPDHVLVDGDPIRDLDLAQTGVPRGDERSAAIAAASIVAKVTRDRMMVEFDAKYPGYGFAVHKGYGTPEHIAALRRLGPCEIHRRSFRTVHEAGGGSHRYAGFRSELLSAENEAALESAATRIAESRGELDAYELARLRSLYKRCYVRLAAHLTGTP